MFDKLRDENPEALNKIEVIEGDVMKLGLGISELDLEKLKACTVVFHSAASVRFNDPLQEAILMNTRGTREVCKLAQSMTNLKTFIHVSTAYIQPRNFYVQEKIYSSDADWRTFIEMAENLDDKLLDMLTPKWVIYSFSISGHESSRILANSIP